MDPLEFAREVEEYMEALGLRDLPGSGLRFPAVGWDLDDCCHACVWLVVLGHELPGNLVARMVFLGSGSPLVRLYFQWVEFRQPAQNPVGGLGLSSFGGG